jgi:uncharacterized FlaG/YvyC family protein
MSIASVNTSVSAQWSTQRSTPLNRAAGNGTPQVAGQGKDALEIKQKEKPDLLAGLKAIEAQISARAQQAANVNRLDISYQKKEALLSVKVEEQQTGDLVRELQFKDYKAMAYASHGYKGAYIDTKA